MRVNFDIVGTRVLTRTRNGAESTKQFGAEGQDGESE